jgi:hypothetical protein
MPPSSPCSQLLSWITLETWRRPSATPVHANSGAGGAVPAPMYAQIMPPASTVGYEAVRIFALNPSSSGSFIMSTHCPVTSNFQP